jgi:hypothetical protein
MYHAPTASISVDQIRQRVKGVALPRPYNKVTDSEPSYQIDWAWDRGHPCRH